MEDNNVSNEINKFYKLKKKYDSKNNKKKMTILNDDKLTITEKKELLKNMKTYCANCNNEGGTNFIVTNKLLSATCNSKKKCKLNINIKKDIHYNIRDEYYKIFNKFNDIKLELIKIKNSAINNLITNEEAIELFAKYKEEYKNLERNKDVLLNKYNNIIYNKENNIKITNINNDLTSQIDEIKFNINKYSEKNNNTYIKNVIDIYNNIVNNINKDIRSIKYFYYNVECLDNTELPCKENKYKLCSDKYNFETLFQSNIYY